MSKASDILGKSGAGGAGGGKKSVIGKPVGLNPLAKPASTSGDAPPKSSGAKSQRGGSNAAPTGPAASKVTNIRPKV